jgi:folate-binding protein YgfZ
MDETRDLGLLSSAAVLVDPAKELIVATGSDRVRFLHGIVTGDVAGTSVGGGCHAALLTLKAHVVAEMRIFVREADLYLVVAQGQAVATADALSRYAIMDDFAAAPRPDFSCVAILGPAAAARLASVGYVPGDLEASPAWSHRDVSAPAGPLWLARARQLGTDGYWVGGAASQVTELVGTLGTSGVSRLSAEVSEAARIAAGEPAWGREITSDYFPMEVGLDGAIDYTKGCFLGQEPIVRIRDRGHTNWRLVRLNWEGAGEPHPGDRLESDVKPKAGRLTSFARLPDGRGVALALAHVSVPVGQQVRIVGADGISAGSAIIAG